MGYNRGMNERTISRQKSFFSHLIYGGKISLSESINIPSRSKKILEKSNTEAIRSDYRVVYELYEKTLNELHEGDSRRLSQAKAEK